MQGRIPGIVAGLGAALALANTGWTAENASAAAPRPEVVAVYYPHWHLYDHGEAWKGTGWTEWVGLKAAVPRFPGHNQPLKPTWGCFDESDPQWTAKEIDLAADHGIDVFLYDWYWYSGVRNMEEALEQGFLKAPNRNRMKFALMWANHDRKDQFCPAFGAPRNVWLPSHHSPRDLERVIDYGIAHYFREPNYWRVEGGLFFSVFQGKHFVDDLGGPESTRALLAKMDDRLRAAGLPPMHWNGMVSTVAEAKLLQAAGFKSTSRYNVSSAGKARADGTERYEDVMEAHRQHWKKMLDAPLVNVPVVTRGWDASPRCRADVPWPFPRNEYPYTPVVVGNTPARFETLLRDAKQFVQNDPHRPFAILINAWNEWTEGGYLLPEEKDGTAPLEAIRTVFGTGK
jgi:hypothetical protein